MIQTREDAARLAALDTANKMVAAALTAPKACGVDDVGAAILTGVDKDVLAKHMRDIADETGEDFYARIGRIGGRIGTTGGFAANRELARIAGQKGGRKSKRGPLNKIIKE